jgi:hypothetical protein
METDLDGYQIYGGIDVETVEIPYTVEQVLAEEEVNTVEHLSKNTTIKQPYNEEEAKKLVVRLPKTVPTTMERNVSQNEFKNYFKHKKEVLKNIRKYVY